MKKLFASLLAATMVAGMAVSAFAYADKNLQEVSTGKESAIASLEAEGKDKDDYSFVKSVIYKGNYKEGYIKDNKEDKIIAQGAIVDGDKLFFPIVVKGSECDFADDSKQDDSYFYATKASEVEDLKAKVKATIGGKYVEKDAEIVKREIALTGADGKVKFDTNGKIEKSLKVYCVRVKTADFIDTEEKEIEFDLTLYNKNKKQVELEDVDFTFGSDAKDLQDGKMIDGEFTKAPKFKSKDGDLTLYLKKDAKAYNLEECADKDGNKEDIELITLEFEEADNDASFEVKASGQDDLFLGYSTDADKAIVVANPDAEINFLDFDANPTFDFMGDLRLTVEDPEKTNFCYELKDGKVTPIGKYNAEDECFEIRTRQLTSYVLSDKELVNAATAEEEKPADKPAEEKPADKIVPSGALA